MHSGVESPLPLRVCGTCRKPFLNESSYNRHVLYCRRSQHRTRTRVRACRACNLAKVKCTQQHPCLRCTNKGIQCVYETTPAPIIPTSKDGPVVSDSSTGNLVEDSSPLNSFPGHDTPGALDEWCEPAGAHDMVETQIPVDWDTLDLTTNGVFPGTPKDALPCLPGTMDHHRPLVDSRPCMDGFDVTCDPDNLLAPTIASPEWTVLRNEQIPALIRQAEISEQPDSGFLSPIPMSDPVSHCTANVIMQMLRAFPQMMLRRETFPPFIHGHWHRSSHATEPSLPTPLVSCMGIAQVFASHNLDTRPFLWRSIQIEQEKVGSQLCQRLISKQELLAVIQAQLIYIMMRIIDNSPAPPGMNFKMLVIYQNLCESFKDLCNQPFFQDERQYPSSDWEDWIFSESRRRTVVVWLLIARLVQIKIGVQCDSFDGFREIPLPAGKTLWDARTRVGWQTEHEIYKTMPRGGLNTFGDLIDVCKQSEIGPNKLKLDAWNSTVDSLGILLTLAASII